MASAAREALDSVVSGDFQSMPLPFPEATFDCMIFADILEHLVDPAAALRRIRPLLGPNGVIVCSIPNIRHYTVFLQLALHGWEYRDFGLFDRTHLRFFSLTTMHELFAHAGFQAIRTEPHIIASKKMMVLDALCFGHLEEFLAQQYLFLAKPLS